MELISFLILSKAEEIKEEAEYSGIRIKLTAKVGTARNTIQIDFGFGDVAIPQPLLMDYPTLLNNKSAKGARIFKGNHCSGEVRGNSQTHHIQFSNEGFL